MLLQSVLGKNIHRHQPFDYDESFNLLIDDPRSVKDQSMQNVLHHWIPRFIVDAYIELVIENNKKAHTITYKDPRCYSCPNPSNTLRKFIWN